MAVLCNEVEVFNGESEQTALSLSRLFGCVNCQCMGKERKWKERGSQNISRATVQCGQPSISSPLPGFAESEEPLGWAARRPAGDSGCA